MAVMVPILLILGCVYFCYIKRKNLNQNSSWNFKKFEPRSLSNSRANLRSQSMGNLTDSGHYPIKRDAYIRQQSVPNLDQRDSVFQPSLMDESIDDTESRLGKSPLPIDEPVNLNFDPIDSDLSDSKSDLAGLPKKRRSYEKIYRTNEPLIGSPSTEFPKLWDLEEEAVSSGSNDDSDRTNPGLSKPAKDIRYINQNKPRQIGRRAERNNADSGYSTSTLPLDPLPYSQYNAEDQYSPVSSIYSPSTSEPYSPSTSPISETSPRQTFKPSKFIKPIPEEPKSASPSKLKSFFMPSKKVKSFDALNDNPNRQGVVDPIQQGSLNPSDEIQTFSSRTTMV